MHSSLNWFCFKNSVIKFQAVMRSLSLRIKILAVHVWFKAPACRGPIRYKNLSYVIPRITGQLIERVSKVDCRLVSTKVWLMARLLRFASTTELKESSKDGPSSIAPLMLRDLNDWLRTESHALED